MKKCDDLTTRILRWQKTGEGFEEILEEISLVVLDYPKKHFGWESDDAAEFYCYFYRRLLRLMTSFEYYGLPFKALLNNSLYWQIRTYYRRNRRKESREGCTKYDCILQAEIVNDSSELTSLEVTGEAEKILKLDKDGIVANIYMKRRLIMLVLKSAPFVNAVHVEAVADLTGCSRLWLHGAVYKLRAGADRRKLRFQEFCIRSNKAYIEICQIHRAMADYSLSDKSGYLERLTKAKKRLDNACLGKTTVKIVPTNNEIAEIMNVPKGSIDSGLYYMRKYLQVLVE